MSSRTLCKAFGMIVFSYLCKMDELRHLINDEYRYKMPDDVFGRFVGAMIEVRLKNREVLIPYGKLDTNVYIHKSGIIRGWSLDGDKEKTQGFSNPGTVLISYHSYFMREPSFYQYESCGESTVMKISKKEVDELIRTSHEFAQWMLVVQSQKLYFNEFKSAVINGTAKDRYVALIKSRPEIIARVPLKIIASYLGVTPNYLSNLKRALQE